MKLLIMQFSPVLFHSPPAPYLLTTYSQTPSICGPPQCDRPSFTPI